MTRLTFKMTVVLLLLLACSTGRAIGQSSQSASLKAGPGPATESDPGWALDAVKRRDHKALAAFLKSKADANAAQSDGATALAWAIYLDDTEAAQMLLSPR